jgi:hypothetical protein
MSRTQRKIISPQWSPFIIKIFLGIKEHFSYVLVIIIAAALGLLSELITDNLQRILYLFILIVGAVVILIISYIVDLIETGKEFGLLRYVPIELIVHHKMYRAIFDDETFDGKEYTKSDNTKKNYKCAKIVNYWVIQNKMDSPYITYKTSMESKLFVPDYSFMTCYIDGHLVKLERNDDEPKYYHKYAYEEGEEKHESIHKDIQFPVHLEPYDFATIEMQYPSAAFQYAIDNKEDSYSVKMSHLTEKITVEFILKGKFKSNYRFTDSNEHDSCDGSRKTFHVIDQSGQRMRKTEEELKQMKMVPRYSNSKIKWVVYYPKIGYTYRLFFTMEKPAEM